MANYVDGPSMPLGLGMALAQNNKAMDRFAALSDVGRAQLIEKTHLVHSKKEMQQLVADFAEGITTTNESERK